MKKVMWLALTTLTVSFAFTTSIAQISRIDSNTVSVEKNELKHIIRVNIVKNYLDSTLTVKQDIIEVQERRITDKDSIILGYKSNLDIMQNQLAEQRPAWYDKFLIGFLTATITILLMVKI